MKSSFYPAIILLFSSIAISCSSNADRSTQKDSIPAPLKEDNSDVSYMSKRGADNLFDEIYNDLLKNRTDLKKLEEEIDANRDMQKDSLKSFKNYRDKSESYYSSATNEIDNIQDSLLKKEIKKLIKDNKLAYQNKIADQTKLLADIDKAALTLNDSHTVLKLLVTLPVIAQYQNSQLPANKRLQVILAAKQKLIDQTKSLTPKNRATTSHPSKTLQ